MSFAKKIAGAGGFGLGGLVATKKISPLAAISPAAALISGSRKKPAEQKPTSLFSRTGDFSSPDTKQIF